MTDSLISIWILSGTTLLSAGMVLGYELGRNEGTVLDWLRTLTKTPDEREESRG